MSKTDNSPRRFSASDAGPRFLLFLKNRRAWRSMEPPAKDSRALEAVMLIVLCSMVFAIVVLVLQVLRNR